MPTIDVRLTFAGVDDVQAVADALRAEYDAGGNRLLKEVAECIEACAGNQRIVRDSAGDGCELGRRLMSAQEWEKRLPIKGREG